MLKNLILLPPNFFSVSAMKEPQITLSIHFTSTMILLITFFFIVVKEPNGSHMGIRKHCQMFSITT